MQHYAAVDRHTPRSKFLSNLPDAQGEWRRRAKALRIRRERLLKQRLRTIVKRY